MKISMISAAPYGNSGILQGQYNRKQQPGNPLHQTQTDFIQQQTQKAAQMIDRRYKLKEAEQEQEYMDPIYSGFQKMQKEEEAIKKRAKGIKLYVVEFKENDVKGQLQDLFGAIGNMKVYADVIKKYENWASEESYPEEERRFYEEAIVALKMGMDDEFVRQSDIIKGLARSEVTTDQLKDILFEGMSFADLSGDMIWKYLDRAQRALKECGYETEEDSLKNICMGNLEFEYKMTSEVRGFKKYGRVHKLGVEDFPPLPSKELWGASFQLQNLNKENIEVLPPPVFDEEEPSGCR